MIDRKERRKKWLNFIMASGFILLFLLGFGLYNLYAQNNAQHKFSSTVNNSEISIQMNAGSKHGDRWETVIQLSESPEDLATFTGETCSCVISNKGKCDIKDWTIKINIKQDCFLNGFWCGDFEVHQFRNGNENVALIKNGQTDVSGLNLEHNAASSNLMVSLHSGDYLVYYPSASAKEDLIKSHGVVSMGFILYYRGGIVLSDYEMSYYSDIKFYDSLHFKIYLIFVALWILSVVYTVCFMLADRRYNVEIDNSIRSISTMAEMYLEVHIINLKSDTGYCIKGNQENLLFNFVGCKVTDCFEKYIQKDCKEKYRSDLEEFLSLPSIIEKIKIVSSISFEYESKSLGWCMLRFFQVHRNEKDMQLVFTVQDIGDEKLRQLKYQDNLLENEYSKLFHGRFLETVNVSQRAIVGEILRANGQLFSSLNSDEEKKLSMSIDCLAQQSQLLQDSVNDMFLLESGKFEVHNEQYNFMEMIEKTLQILNPYYEGKPFEFQKSIDSSIPAVLEGDCQRIMEILMLLLFSAFFTTRKGVVKLSVFAKNNGGEEELLISIKDSADGFTEEQVKEIHSFLEGERISSFDNPSLVYIKIIDGILRNMKSKLNVVSVYGEGSEFYFSLSQKITEKN